MQTPACFRFVNLTFDPTEKQLSSSDSTEAPIQLTKRQAEVLQCLSERKLACDQNNYVTKHVTFKEFQKQLWPKEDVIARTVLGGYVSKLNKRASELVSDKSFNLIQNVHGDGYYLDAKVVRCECVASNSKAAASKRTHAQHGRVQSADANGLSLIDLYKKRISERYRETTLVSQTLSVDRNFFPLKAQLEKSTRSDPIAALDYLIGPARRTCVVGPSGSGKTTLVRRLVWALQEHPEVAFFIALRDFATSTPEAVTPDTILEWVRASVRASTPEVMGDLDALVTRRQGVFIFDGFDELRGNRIWAMKVGNAIVNTFLSYDEARVIVTTRRVDDLLGRFDGYAKLRITPLSRDDLPQCMDTLDIDWKEAIRLRELFESAPALAARPINIVIASAYIRRGKRGPHAGATGSVATPYKLLEATLKMVLGEEERYRSPGMAVAPKLLQKQLRDVRLEILQRIVHEWRGSSRMPCTVARSTLEKHLSDAGKRFDSQVDLAEHFGTILPTGICLERLPDDRDTFRFCHNSFQDFFYARALLAQLNRNGVDMLKTEYYSAEVLRLAAGELTPDLIGNLFRKLEDATEEPMIRKGIAGLLGFVPDSPEFQFIRNRLSAAFETTADVGVAGRIAEAMRRHGDSRVIRSFISKLSAHVPNTVRKDASGRLTFEIDQPLENFHEYEADIAAVLNNRSANVRKQAFILLLRLQGDAKLQRHNAVRFALGEWQRLVNSNNACPERFEVIRAFRYGIEGLRRVGCAIETAFLGEIESRLVAQHDLAADAALVEHLNDVLQHLKMVDWLPERFLSESFWEKRSNTRVFFVRHAESEVRISRDRDR